MCLFRVGRHEKRLNLWRALWRLITCNKSECSPTRQQHQVRKQRGQKRKQFNTSARKQKLHPHCIRRNTQFWSTLCVLKFYSAAAKCCCYHVNNQHGNGIHKKVTRAHPEFYAPESTKCFLHVVQTMRVKLGASGCMVYGLRWIIKNECAALNSS